MRHESACGTKATATCCGGWGYEFAIKLKKKFYKQISAPNCRKNKVQFITFTQTNLTRKSQKVQKMNFFNETFLTEKNLEQFKNVS